MIITYMLGSAVQHAMVLENTALWIEKMKKVGACNFICYNPACGNCSSGLVQIDADGTEEPCKQCKTGREYAMLTREQVAQVEAIEYPF